MSNPFRDPTYSRFLPGEPQEESLARLEYLRDHAGGGWCQLSGPPGIGKSALLAELTRRAIQRGETCAALELGPSDAADLLALTATAWNLAVALTSDPLEIRRALEEFFVGQGAMNRPAWLLLDQVRAVSPDLERTCRWLTRSAQRAGLALTLVVACGVEEESAPAADADLRLELWPWEQEDCRRYLELCCEAAGVSNPFQTDAVAELVERSEGIPGRLAKHAEWAWLAADAEAERTIGSAFIDAVAEEFSPRFPRRAGYEVSAAYGAW